MMSKTRSAFLSLYAALTPALASAKCGNVDYSWGADALASAHDYAVTMMLVPFGICSGGHRGHSQRLADIYKDEYGRRRSEEEHHDAGGSLPVPHRSDHRLPRFLRLSDLRYR